MSRGSLESKKQHLEILRIIAAFFVIFNHTEGYMLFSKMEITSFKFLVYLCVSIFSKISVPIFFMISGALLLPRNESIYDIYKKRIVRVAIVIVLISFFYCAYNYKMYGIEISLKEILTKIYTSQINGHLWYLYSYMAFLISLPLMRSWMQNLTNQLFVYMFCVALFFISVLPTIEYLLGSNLYTLNANMKPSWLTSNIILYPCLGYYIENRIEVKSRKKLIAVVLLAILGMILSVYLTWHIIVNGNAESSTQIFHNMYICPIAGAVFLLVKNFIQQIPKKIEKIVLSLGSCTFGIYLVHIAIKDYWYMRNLAQYMLNLGLNEMFVWLTFSFIVLLLSGWIVWLLKRIPMIKNVF